MQPASAGRGKTNSEIVEVIVMLPARGSDGDVRFVQ
jgi:hypothetical protein